MAYVKYKELTKYFNFNKLTSADILLSFDSGYQMELRFIRLDAQGKTNLRKLFAYIFNNK